jgi:hypothetical protein
VAIGVKCGPHGGKNSEKKSWMVSWLSLKTKFEPGHHRRQDKSGDWRRLHRVREVSSGSTKNHWAPWLIQKAKDVDWSQQHQVGLIGEDHQSDRRAMT